MSKYVECDMDPKEITITLSPMDQFNLKIIHAVVDKETGQQHDESQIISKCIRDCFGQLSKEQILDIYSMTD